MANINSKTIGGKPELVAVFTDVTSEWYPPPAGHISHLAIASQCAGDCTVGNIVGAIG